MHKALSLCYCALLLNNGFAQEHQRPERIDSFKGNAFTVKDLSDTTTILDPVTLEINTVIRNPSPIPVKMNAMNIYGKSDVSKLPGVTEQTLKNYLLFKLGDKITGLGDGAYRLILNSVVISDKGTISFYDYVTIERHTRIKVKDPGSRNIAYREDWTEIEATQDKPFVLAVHTILDKAPQYTPAFAGGFPVPCRLSDEEFKRPFYIHGGKIYHNK